MIYVVLLLFHLIPKVGEDEVRPVMEFVCFVYETEPGYARLASDIKVIHSSHEQYSHGVVSEPINKLLGNQNARRKWDVDGLPWCDKQGIGKDWKTTPNGLDVLAVQYRGFAWLHGNMDSCYIRWCEPRVLESDRTRKVLICGAFFDRSLAGAEPSTLLESHLVENFLVLLQAFTGQVNFFSNQFVLSGQFSCLLREHFVLFDKLIVLRYHGIQLAFANVGLYPREIGDSSCQKKLDCYEYFPPSSPVQIHRPWFNVMLLLGGVASGIGLLCFVFGIALCCVGNRLGWFLFLLGILLFVGTFSFTRLSFLASHCKPMQISSNNIATSANNKYTGKRPASWLAQQTYNLPEGTA